MFTRILLASDGSEDALRAADAAATLAKSFGAALTAVHVFVVPLTAAALYGVPGIGMDPGSLSVLETRSHEDVLRRTGQVLDRHGAAYKTRRETGNPAERIVQAAREEQADLIVLGSHGH